METEPVNTDATAADSEIAVANIEAIPKEEPIAEDTIKEDAIVESTIADEPIAEDIIDSNLTTEETVKENPTVEESTKKSEDAVEPDTPDQPADADTAAASAAAPVVPRVIYDLLPDYVLIGQVDAEQLIAGPTRPATRQECEVVMLIGLPGSGKTTWALNYAKEHEDKNFYLLSQATILDRTTVTKAHI